MENSELTNVLPVLWKWKKEIIGSVLGATVLASVIMLTKPNYYEGTTTFYPVSSTLLKPIVEGTERDLQYFGDDHDVDRMLAISKSSQLSEQIIRDFDLAKIYQIDTSRARGRIKLRKRFNKHYTVTKTQYDAIRVSMEDKNPQRAADIANGIRQLIDQKSGELVKKALKDILDNIEKSVEDKRKKKIEITKNIKDLRQKYKIYDTQSQGEALANMEARSPNNSKVKELIDGYTLGVTDVINLEGEMEELNKILTRDADNLEKIKATYQVSNPSIHVVESAVAADEKSRPKRSLYVLATAVLSFVVAFLVVLAVEKAREIDWSQL